MSVENDQSFFRRAPNEAGYQKSLIVIDISLTQKIMDDRLAFALLSLCLNETTGLQVLENKSPSRIFQKCRLADSGHPH
ncbi:hypothetical protein DK68_3090 [Brucella suis]|nr:conserved hypothetical protein [Brucella melitensis M28]AEW13388.1 Dihydroorotase-related cyclic amidohydrolase [Brucella canis HSK A52141]EFG37672.1 predicted protein [Brucella sp. NVSL 07-0026]ENR42753.1 hypothetical protein C063_00642 [Brucella suis F8/06-2]ENT58663.1 hypothetical protein C007_00690 [Brucella suis F8/06-1]ENT62946.1 hypothetical protein B968_01025 [Brucella suis F8/06-3]ENT65230.1 hypothetical protein C008_00691 [Brucella suis F9/06-1]ERU16646.1 hypothetical protein P0